MKWGVSLKCIDEFFVGGISNKMLIVVLFSTIGKTSLFLFTFYYRSSLCASDTLFDRFMASQLLNKNSAPESALFKNKSVKSLDH